MTVDTSSYVSGALRRVLVHPTGGVAGLVDELLTLCQEHDLQLHWQADGCRLRSRKGDWEELIDVPFRKSVFRAILARIAALCNERIPNSVSPYGGQGEFSAGANPRAVFRVTFSNTPAEQRLELTTDHRPAAEAPQQHEHFEISGLAHGNGPQSPGVGQNQETAAVLRRWGDLWTRLESSRIGSLCPAEWSSVEVLIEAMTSRLGVQCSRLQALLHASGRQLAPLADPLTVDLGLHSWLAADREEAYSDWLAWVLSQLPDTRMLYRLFGLHCPPELEHAKIQPLVHREAFVPFGHMGSKGRLDLFIKLENHAIMVEVKTGSADESDTIKHTGYKQSVPDTPAVLIATDGELPEYNGFELRPWASVCQELRKLIPELIPDRGITVAALMLAFVGAVEQNLLRFRSWMADPSVVQQVRLFDSRLLDHLQGSLGRECLA
jgi:hypothetical protein